jgi:hypothetical protein
LISSKLDIPADSIVYSNTNGKATSQVFPFIEAGTTEASKKTTVVTVLSAQSVDLEAAPSLAITEKKSGFLINVEKQDTKHKFEISMTGKYPIVKKLS